jgi:hypothetical protein
VELKEVPTLERSGLAVVEAETLLEPVKLENLVVGPAVVATDPLSELDEVVISGVEPVLDVG